MTQSQRLVQWQEHIANFKASGQTMKTWCAAQGFTIHQLKYWLRKLPRIENHVPSATSWLAMEVSGPKPEQQTEPLVVRIGPSAIEIRPGFNAALLRQVVQVLGASC